MEQIALYQQMENELFSQKWRALHESNALQEKLLQFPGVYILAYSDAALEEMPIREEDIFYVGQSNSTGGVKQRLSQFKKGIERPDGNHSAARTFYAEYCVNRPYSELEKSKRLFFATKIIECEADKSKATPADFRLMGHVLCLENYIIARVLERTQRTPKLNKLGEREELAHSAVT